MGSRQFEFTSNDGTLTPTLKLRRSAIEARYHEQIDELYKEAERPPAWLNGGSLILQSDRAAEEGGER